MLDSSFHRTTPLLFLIVVLGLTSSACDVRPPGPLEEERGLVSFWEIVEADVTFDQCTDSPTWRNTFPEPSDFLNAFISYRVSEDGRSAVRVQCTTTDPTTCSPVDPPEIFTVEGNVLTLETPPAFGVVAGIDCEQSIAGRWRLVDEGSDMQVEIVNVFELTGTATACDELNNVFVQLGTNQTGIRSCQIIVNAQATNQGAR